MVFKRVSLLKSNLNFMKCYLRSSTNLSTSNIVSKKIGSITCIGLNRPQYKNCLNEDLFSELNHTIELFEKDDNSKVAVLYGERGNFSHGFDAKEFQENPKLIEDMEIKLFQKYPVKPIVAAVTGFATGPGFHLALWCDFRIVEDTAVLGGYARRFGMPVNDILLERVYSLLGLSKAMDLILTGRNMNSKEALDCGVATRIVACGTGVGQAVNFANSLANMPQACLQADRAALISLSNKYSEQTIKFILEEKEIKRKLAVKEAEEGLHITLSGDVRVRK